MSEDPKERFRVKRQAYLRTFCNDAGQPHPEALKVLADLHRFCRMDRSGLVVSPNSVMVDSHATVHAVGLRDVYLRIAGFIGLRESLALGADHDGSSTDPDADPKPNAQPVTDT